PVALLASCRIYMGVAAHRERAIAVAGGALTAIVAVFPGFHPPVAAAARARAIVVAANIIRTGPPALLPGGRVEVGVAADHEGAVRVAGGGLSTFVALLARIEQAIAAQLDTEAIGPAPIATRVVAIVADLPRVEHAIATAGLLATRRDEKHGLATDGTHGEPCGHAHRA